MCRFVNTASQVAGPLSTFISQVHEMNLPKHCNIQRQRGLATDRRSSFLSAVQLSLQTTAIENDCTDLFDRDMCCI